ncbi:hypothetical protein [Rahnella selenatireducens]|uniref:hypothetical protein n=1 Tax=Rahnella selenatireducens TaxID=3389797 RepID=UPI003968BE9C
MTKISELERMNSKTLYAYKANAMEEKGLISLLSLVNHWKMVHLSELYLENFTIVKGQKNEVKKPYATPYAYQTL